MNAYQEIIGLLPPEGEITGRDLRAAYNSGKWWWQRYSGPGFYLLMCKLQDAGLVNVLFEDRVVDGQSVRLSLFSRR